MFQTDNEVTIRERGTRGSGLPSASRTTRVRIAGTRSPLRHHTHPLTREHEQSFAGHDVRTREGWHLSLVHWDPLNDPRVLDALCRGSEHQPRSHAEATR